MPIQAAAGERRLKALEDPRWVQAMITLIKGHKYFRWHDSGDIQSMQHLENIFRICRATPETKHWIPTREAQFLKRLKLKQVPRNLVIRMSSHMVDQGPVNFWPGLQLLYLIKIKKHVQHLSKKTNAKIAEAAGIEKLQPLHMGNINVLLDT